MNVPGLSLPVTRPRAALHATATAALNHWCETCIDRRRSNTALIGDAAGFKAVVLDGERKHQGMVSFAPVLKDADADAIRAYLIKAAGDGYAAEPCAKN